jgi:hypothetical protein
MTSHPDTTRADEQAIDRTVQAFFGLFTNRNGVRPNLGAIFDLCIPEAIISKCVAPAPEVFTLEEFIAPREALLCNGTLTDFQESETAERTVIVGNIAQRVCTYAKSGVLDGVPFRSRGVKVFQLIRSPAGWRIAAVAWDDEREGLTIDRAALGLNQPDG